MNDKFEQFFAVWFVLSITVVIGMAMVAMGMAVLIQFHEWGWI